MLLRGEGMFAQSGVGDCTAMLVRAAAKLAA
jgi:hypothetical protein